MPLVSPGYIVPPDVQAESGFQAGIVGAPPAVGQPFDRRVPGEFFEIPVAVVTTYSADATVANRTVSLQVLDGDNKLLDFSPSNVLQTAGQAISYRWSLTVASPYSIPGVYVALPLFAFVLQSGYHLRVTASGLQAGDQILAVQMVMQQLLTGIKLEDAPTVQPLDLSGLGVITASPLSAATPSAAPLPSAAPVAASVAAPVRTVAPAPTLTPTYQELADAAALGGPVIRE